MIYTKMTKEALKICFNAHKEQTDKSDLPYVFHPFHLAEQMDDEESTIVALLHDVVEDSGDKYSFDDLHAMGFSETVVDALKLMTHEEGVPYLDYIRKIKTNPLATKVKLADLAHNSDETRMDPNQMTDDEKAQMKKRLEKYQKSRDILLGVID